jgi:hypothetical protein
MIIIIIIIFAQSKNTKDSRQPLLGNGTVNTPAARWWLRSRHVTAATHKQARREELLEAVFSVWSGPRLYITRTSCQSRELTTTSPYISTKTCLRQGIYRQGFHKVPSYPQHCTVTARTPRVYLGLFVDVTCIYATDRKEGNVLRKLQRGLSVIET